MWRTCLEFKLKAAALKLLANLQDKENFTDAVYEGTKGAKPKDGGGGAGEGHRRGEE